jgi:hypothetical protein
MSRNELIETAAAVVSGVAAAICYTALYMMMAGPSVETLRRLLS